ncbi:CIA30 family protein [Portibacter lacus]|uniref:NADH:ubiquinone oxidoreductase n=1 Tax=Portibacter lacus TaxID=1099794 RepID=A0AA37WFG1_9BACT|nr:CIA30 family protein [Portibacter lacus]GLR19946.1 NADH:ubiquinone oxidoreductase [Portibacter lacus]
MVLFDFNKDSSLDQWVVVDDNVMGGRSDGRFLLNDNGHAVFKGEVSLENNGGFSSVRYSFDQIEVKDYTKMVLRIKGDGKRYQFRVKPDRNDRHSYIYYFETSGEWQNISIPLTQMKPFFRGRKLDIPNYSAQELEEVAILISNKKAESFKLEIDKITLK